jgi:hypothetical protein
MTTTLLGHPSGTREVALERQPRAVGFGVWVDAQHDPRDITPVRTFIVGVEQPEVGDDVLFVVCGERWTGRRDILAD